MSKGIYDAQQKILRGKFDIEIHKKTFVNYLEVVIREDGTVEYAVPSHQEKLIRIAMDRLKVSRQELYNLCPPEYYFDVVKWQCMVSRCVAVWDDFYIGMPNEMQQKALQNLKYHELYRGKL